MKNIYITYTTRLSYDMYELIIEDGKWFFGGGRLMRSAPNKAPWCQ